MEIETNILQKYQIIFEIQIIDSQYYKLLYINVLSCIFQI